MKATLTADDPIGWYLCRRIHAKHLCCNWWDREHLRSSPLLGELNLSLYEDFRRLFTESDVASLQQDLAANEALVAESIKGAEQVNEELRMLREELATNKHSLDVCSKYAESMQRSSEDYLNELRKAREENATLQNQADSLLKQAEQLEAELARLKSQPYVMRQANEPDCEGLWRNCCGAIREWHETDLAGSNGFHYGPYHYIGPLPVIPVVVEQQPPKVVKVRERKTGVTADAIIGNIKGLYTLLSLDGKACSVVSVDNWEEVQK